MGEAPVVKPSSGRPPVGKREQKSNVATLSSLNSSSEEEEDTKGQAFYAGGSQTSGQQVLGPPRKKNPIKDYVQEVFKKAQSGQLDQFDPSDAPGGSAGASQARSFVGAGYRLGETDDDHQMIQSGSGGAKKKSDEYDTVTVKVFGQGFTVDDGELRPYEDPRNREFFESITRNEIPAELRKQGRSMVHVNVEDHLHENFVKQTPKFKAFTGSGQTLGSPTPAMADEVPVVVSGDPAANEARANQELNVQQDQPSTMISIRLADGGRLSSRFNLTHTIDDIRGFITTARPQYAGRTFVLLTTFPNKELSNNTETIQQAGLQNAAILQRLK